jgi:hypothetical protein
LTPQLNIASDHILIFKPALTVKVSHTICQRWQKQNARKKDHAFNGVANGHASWAAASQAIASCQALFFPPLKNKGRFALTTVAYTTILVA